jgi:hypothetical protein
MPRNSPELGLVTVTVLIALGLSVGGLLLLPASANPAGPSPVNIFSSTARTPAVDNVSIGTQTIGSLAPIWGVDLRPEYRVGSATTAEVQGTPITYVRWPGGAIADRFNMSTGAVYFPSSTAPTNESEFVTWCRSVGCQAILQVPGEIDSPSTAAWEVAYTEHRLGFSPAYWEIGNEPGLWTHFGQPWSAWKSSRTSTATPQTYAELVHQYIAAMRAVDPSIRIIGLPGVGLGAYFDPAWISSTVAVNGPNLSAVAIHVYPAQSGPSHPTLSAFFASLSGRSSISVRMVADDQAIAAACPTCGPIAVFVTELGSGSQGGGSWGSYMSGYPEVPFVAAELSQAVASNVTSTELYCLEGTYSGSLFGPTGRAHPLDLLYADLLSHLGPVGIATGVSGPVSGVYAIGSEPANGSSASVMVVNTNVTSSVVLNLTGPGFPAAGSYSLWWWNSSSPVVDSASGTGPTSHWTLPPLGILVVSEPKPASPARYPVSFQEIGLPGGSPWTVTITGSVPVNATTNASDVTFDLANGSYTFTVTSAFGFPVAPSQGTLVVNGTSLVQPILYIATLGTNAPPGRAGNESRSAGPTGPAPQGAVPWARAHAGS